MLDRLGLDRVDDLVGWIHGAKRSQVASLAPLVVETARRGDDVAEEIVRRAVEELERHVLTMWETLGPWSAPPSLALAGGLLHPGGPLRDRVEEALAEHRIRPLPRKLDPALGAARMALTLEG